MGSEILLILFVVLLLFGADKLPETARTLARIMREVRKATDDIKTEITNSTAEVKNELEGLKTDLEKKTSELKENIDDVKDEVGHSLKP